MNKLWLQKFLYGLNLIFLFAAPSAIGTKPSAESVCQTMLLLAASGEHRAIDKLHELMEMPEFLATPGIQNLMDHLAAEFPTIPERLRTPQMLGFLREVVRRRDRHLFAYFAENASVTLFEWGQHDSAVIDGVLAFLGARLPVMDTQDEFEQADRIRNALAEYGNKMGVPAFFEKVRKSYEMAVRSQQLFFELKDEFSAEVSTIHGEGAQELVESLGENIRLASPAMFYLKMYEAWALNPNSPLQNLSTKEIFRLAQSGQKQAISVLIVYVPASAD